MFSVFEDSNYLGFALEPEQALGEAVDRTVTPLASAAILPPGPPNEDRVASYLGGPARGLPRDQSYNPSDYDPDLSLDFVAPPSAGVAVDRFGAGLGGSVGFFFSDMLGDKQMGISGIANGGAKDIGGEIAFADLGGRTNWGVHAGRIPYRSVIARSGVVEVDGQQVPVVDLVLRRVYQSAAEFAAEYPFSQTRRIEGSAGFTRYDYDFDLFRTFFLGGGAIGTDEQDLSALEPDPLNLLTGSVALVDDYSFFGFTSPVRGGRSRFEVGGNFGSLDFATVLADYRRYFFARPITLAFRGLHYGRYGPDAENEDALIPLFLGYEWLVRGYSPGSFEGSECTPVEDSTACPEFDRLIGSRIGVVNAELRMPIFGAEEFGLLGEGFLPTELALWADGGVAWTKDESPEFKFERNSADRIPVFSVGASLRVNLFGALIGEFYYSYPFQRPEDGGHFGFQIAPGW
jgi:hypothetical protein